LLESQGRRCYEEEKIRIRRKVLRIGQWELNTRDGRDTMVMQQAVDKDEYTVIDPTQCKVIESPSPLYSYRASSTPKSGPLNESASILSSQGKKNLNARIAR
jgi:hypothetical protein